MELAHRCGATGLAERARTELRATGARPRRLVRTGADALTPSERRVAELAAAGRTNREIAAELYVTLATVETHLRHAFQKLDVHARTALRDALAEKITVAP
jgi:DNA-binding NarL/FixJ family response regulator